MIMMEATSVEKQKNNSISDKHSCKVCGKSFPFNSRLITHERIHTGEKPYKCEICEKSYSESGKLSKHKRTHTGEKPYECAICKKAFISSSKIMDHKRVHTGERPYSCLLCQKSFAARSNLSAHNKTASHLKRMKSKNTNVPHSKSSFTDCGESIKLEYIKEEESVDDPISIYQNTVSSGVYKDIKEESVYGPILIHEKTEGSNVFEDIKEGECEEDILSNQQEIDTFKPVTTESERSEKQEHLSKDYSCRTCGKSLQSLSKLTIHERVHTGEKPYECDICKKAFNRKDRLNEHKRIHTGEKPYSCELCKKAYSRSSKLLKHNRTLAHLSLCEVKSVTMDSSFDVNNFVDCGENIKIETIKEEIKEEESV